MWKIVRAQPRNTWRSAPCWNTHSRSSNGIVTFPGNADAVSNAITPHPGKGRAAGVLRRLPGVDAHAVAAESRTG